MKFLFRPASYTGLFLLALLLLTNACSKKDDDPVVEQPTEARGDVLEVTHQYSYSKQQVDSLYKKEPVLTAGQKINYAIDVYKLKYRTIDPEGNFTTASGVVVIPKDKPTASSILCYEHGTTAKRTGVPSYGGTELYIGIATGAYGFIAVLPDYLGLGDSDFPYHPYIHRKSEATASVDMLRAAKKFAAEKNAQHNGKLYLLGYSQGGHACMATAQELQTYHSSEFTVTAASPGAGPHDASGVQAEFITSPRPYYDPSYLPYVLIGYNNIYHLYSNLNDAIKPQYVQSVLPLFDGNHTTGQINQLMPEAPKDIVQPEVLYDFQTNPNHVFRVALRDNDTWHWKPQMPMKLCHCKGDSAVAFGNSQKAYDEFIANGANPATTTLENMGELNHYECAILCIIQAQTWFLTYEQ